MSARADVWPVSDRVVEVRLLTPDGPRTVTVELTQGPLTTAATLVDRARADALAANPDARFSRGWVVR